jgi:hypothetical protein
MSCNNVNVEPTVIGGGDGSTAYDAFGRLRVSNPLTIFDSQNRFQIDPQYDTATTGSGSTSHLSNESSVQLSVTTASGDEVIRETKRVFPYQPGKSLLVFMTFVMDESQDNLRQRVGYFGANDGVYFEQNDTDKRFVIRTSTSGSASDARFVTQANWNGDKLDGTGASGYTLDTTQSQILYMDFEWLGVGAVRCGFIIDGKFIVCHTFFNANEIAQVYMKTAILPMRYEITATGALSSSADMKQICSTVISEGGYNRYVLADVARRTSATTVGTSFEPLVTIKLNSSYLDAMILVRSFDVLATSTGDDFEIALIKNATLTGASYDTSTFDHVDFDITATALTGGDIHEINYASQGSFFSPGGTPSSASELVYNYALQLGRTQAGVSDTFTLAARVLSGTGDIIGSLSFFDLTNGN